MAVVDSILASEPDTIIIKQANSDVTRYNKKYLKEEAQIFLPLFNLSPPEPDEWLSSVADGSEAGKDTYCQLYAYFLQKRNGEMKYQERRTELINIFKQINEINADLIGGGTYYGHMYKRVAAHAEYAIWLCATDSTHYTKTYDITRQKKFYIQTLQQSVFDEIDADDGNGLSSDDKTGKKKKLSMKIERLSDMITDYFYLSRAQYFQQRYYQ